jgi:ribose transport system substrate-binding protein
MRTLISLLLTVAAAVTLSAAPRTITIGLVAKSQGNPVFQAARVGAEDAAKALSEKHGVNIRIDWRTPNEEDAQKQAEAIEQLVLAGAEGIAVSCSDANKLTDAIDAAVTNGVPSASRAQLRSARRGEGSASTWRSTVTSAGGTSPAKGE